MDDPISLTSFLRLPEERGALPLMTVDKLRGVKKLFVLKPT